MFLTNYDFEEHMKLERKENYEWGYAKGEAAGEARGEAKGEAKGEALGIAKCVCSLLEDICDLPDSWRDRILAEMNTDTLSGWHKIARRAENLEDFLKKAGLA